MSTTQFLLLVLLNVIASSQALADENISLDKNISLDQATALALQANPNIAIVLREREVEGAQLLQAAARPNPTLSGQVQDLRSQNRIVSIAISQQLETAGKRDKRLVAADASLAIADADITIARAETSAKVYASFYQVLAAQQALSLAQELLQIASISKETTAKRVLAGKVSPVEETKSKVVEAGLKLELAQASQQLVSAKQHLVSLWVKGNSDVSVLSFIPINFTAVGELEKLKDLPALNDLMAQLPDSPRLQKSALTISQRQAISAIEKSKQTPDVTLSLGAQRNEELGGITQAIIGLSIPIPVFDKNQGNLQSARARELLALDEKSALENQLQTELSNAYGRRQLQIEASNIYKQDILQGAQSAYEAVRKGFEFGKFSFLEVLDAQRSLFQAKTQYIQTLVLAHHAQADIYTILGTVIIQSGNKE